MPGGAGMLAPNYVTQAAKKDGLTALVTSSHTAAHSLLRTKGAKYDHGTMAIALVAPSGGIFVTRPDKCRKGEDVVKVGKNLIFGCSPMPIGQSLCFMLTKEVLGFETKKDVLGFSGAGEIRRAFLAGEVDIYPESVISYRANSLPYVKRGEAVPMWQTGLYDAQGVLRREPGEVADVPTIKEVYEAIYGKPPSGPAWDALSAYIAYMRTTNKSILFPPGTEKYAAIVREAGVKMAKDPQFLKDYNRINPGVPFYTGEDASKIMKLAAGKAKAVRRWLQDWVTKGWGIKFEK